MRASTATTDAAAIRDLAENWARVRTARRIALGFFLAQPFSSAPDRSDVRPPLLHPEALTCSKYDAEIGPPRSRIPGAFDTTEMNTTRGTRCGRLSQRRCAAPGNGQANGEKKLNLELRLTMVHATRSGEQR